MSAEFLHIIPNKTNGYSFERRRIGFYSIDTDRKFHPDDRNLKYIHHVHPKRTLDLTLGYESYISKDWWLENVEKIDHILEWLSYQQYIRNLIIPQNRKVTFICSRGVLNAVMKTPYEKQDDWRICGTKVGSAIFLCTFFTDTKKNQRKLNQSSEDRKNEYMGFKFEQYLLSDSPEKPPDISSPVNSRDEFYVMYRCQLNQHDIIFGAEVDGIDSLTPVNISHTDLTMLNSLKLVELKTSRFINYKTDKIFQNFKSLKWWTQSYLVGNEKIICGFRNKNSKMITGYNYFHVDNLLSLSENKWNPHVCMNFLDDFFSFVKKTFQHESNFSKWSFDWQLGADKVGQSDENEMNEEDLNDSEVQNGGTQNEGTQNKGTQNKDTHSETQNETRDEGQDEAGGDGTNSQPKKKLFKSPLKKGLMKKRRQEESVNVACEYLKKKFQELEKPTSVPADMNDECYIFGQLIAAKLRKMDYNRRQYAMHDINYAIFQHTVENPSFPGMSPRSLSTSPSQNYRASSSPYSSFSSPSSSQPPSPFSLKTFEYLPTAIQSPSNTPPLNTSSSPTSPLTLDVLGFNSGLP